MNAPAHPWHRRLFFFLKLLEVRLRFVAVLVITALVVGYWDYIQNYWERWTRGKHAEEQAVSEIEYTCAMHPFVVSDRAGKCPICGMDLITRKKGSGSKPSADALPRVQLSPERIHQAGVQTEEVRLRLLTRTVRTYGVIETDETRMRRIIARFPGRVEELLVNAVGMEVEQDTPLLRIYSPRYVAAAREYAQALAERRRVDGDAQAGAEARRMAAIVADSARQALSLAGFTAAQLDQLARSGQVEPRITLHAPLAGTVIEKNVLLGDAVEEGTPLYTLADLSTLWVQAQVLEADLGVVKAGMAVEVGSVAYPAEIFYGTVDLLYPTLNTANRSVKARIVVSNKEGKLKPGMFVTAVLRAPVARCEAVADSGQPAAAPVARAAATVYTCPMHPEVVSDKPGDCPKCGMHLVKSQSAPPSGSVSVSKSVSGSVSESVSESVSGSKSGSVSESVSESVSGSKSGSVSVSESRSGSESNKKAPPPAASSEQWAEGYACPMHLDKLDPRPGICRVCNCGMKMTKWRVERVLAIPETAVIDTGTRQYVFVETEPGLFDARLVTLGPRAEAYYPVLSGLALGDKIAARGSFLIDAEARLNPSAFVEPHEEAPARAAAAPSPVPPPAPPSAPAGHEGHMH